VIVVCFVSVFVSFGVAVVVWFRLGLFFALLGLWLFALLMTQQDCFLTLLHAAAIAAGVCCVCVCLLLNNLCCSAGRLPFVQEGVCCSSEARHRRSSRRKKQPADV
jgi:hypothetical protein